jgi:Holliday junction DNA helicase RuvA
MIGAVRGTLIEKSGDRVIVATSGGVSYEVSVPIGVLERLPKVGTEIHLSTVPIVREDSWALYGFDAPDERTVFQRLLAVNGVGPRLALAIVSTLGGRVVRVLKQGEIAALCTVPGVGKKTAERIALELKDKLRDIAAAGDSEAAVNLPAEQAVHALVNLGYNASDADRAVRAVLSEKGSAETAELIRESLQLLVKAK